MQGVRIIVGMSPKSLPMCSPPSPVRRPNGVATRRKSVKLFRALADPTRLEVLALIASRDEPICVCDIVACFDVSQPTISHHLKTLRDARLVTATRRGTWSYYVVDARGVEALRSALNSVLPEADATGG